LAELITRKPLLPTNDEQSQLKAIIELVGYPNQDEI
jgi:hypothetical protein